jgi:hypothetical protein
LAESYNFWEELRMRCEKTIIDLFRKLGIDFLDTYENLYTVYFSRRTLSMFIGEIQKAPETFQYVHDTVIKNLNDDRIVDYKGTEALIAHKLLVAAEEKIYKHVALERKEREELKRLIEKYGVPK